MRNVYNSVDTFVNAAVRGEEMRRDDGGEGVSRYARQGRAGSHLCLQQLVRAENSFAGHSRRLTSRMIWTVCCPIMKSITYTAARENLASTINRVCEDNAPVVITRINVRGLNVRGLNVRGLNVRGLNVRGLSTCGVSQRAGSQRAGSVLAISTCGVFQRAGSSTCGVSTCGVQRAGSVLAICYFPRSFAAGDSGNSSSPSRVPR